MNKTQPNKMPMRETGMTLIEVLVTLVLISVGLLGVAALQMTSLRNNHEAYFRSQASILAADILERIRADAMGFRAGEYDVDFNGTGAEGTTAGRDLEDWQEQIDRLLPGGEATAAGRIERDGRIATITIRWMERPMVGSFAAPDAEEGAGEPEEGEEEGGGEESEGAEDEEGSIDRLPTFQIRSEI